MPASRAAATAAPWRESPLLSRFGAAGAGPAHAAPPRQPVGAVGLDIGVGRGALVLRAPAAWEGLEVELSPVSEPSRRVHVWVLARRAATGTAHAAVFPSLEPGDYAVEAPGAAAGPVVTVSAGEVTVAELA